jgi:hypothetical protein
LNLSEFVEHISGPDNAALAIEKSWIDNGLIPGPPTPSTERSLSVFLASLPDGRVVVCPTYQIHTLHELPLELSMKGLPFTHADVTLKLTMEDICFPPDVLAPEEGSLDAGVELYSEAILAAHATITVDVVGGLFATHDMLLAVFVSADADGLFVGLVVTRADVLPMRAQPYPEVVGGIRVVLIAGGVDLMACHPAARMKPAQQGAAIGVDPKTTYGTLGAVVVDAEDRQRAVGITAAHVVCATKEEIRTFKKSGKLPVDAYDRHIRSMGASDLSNDPDDYDLLGTARVVPAYDIARIDDPEEWKTEGIVGMALPRRHPMLDKDDEWYEDGLKLSGMVSDVELDNPIRARSFELVKLGATTGMTKNISVFCTFAWAKVHPIVAKYYERLTASQPASMSAAQQPQFVPSDMYKQNDPEESVRFDKGDSGALVWTAVGNGSARAVGIYTGGSHA